jgi:PIN domain nuclease of toxin-antitoxin system
VNVLLDTHAFLWLIAEPTRFSDRVHDLLLDGENRLYFSVASAWEIAIKVKLGKLLLPEPPDRYIPNQLTIASVDVLPIQLSHVLQTYHLPDHHRDPFDRLLVAQAQLEKLYVVSADPLLSRYDIKIVW